MKKISFILLAVIISFTIIVPVSADILHSGNCGDNVTYTVDDEYNLTISGDGRMDDYVNVIDNNIPWKDYRKNIQYAEIGSGVSSIGTFAFANCFNLNNIGIPETVSEIGSRAFGWTSISNIQLPSALTNISYGLFLDCKSLTTIEIPENVTSIQERAFEGCTSLQSIRLHKNITKIEENAFNKCTALKTVYYYGTEEDWNNFINNHGLTNGNEPFIAAKKVFIPEVLPTSISISTKPTYIIGEDTALDIAVNLNNNDGTATTLSPDEYTLETDFNPNTEGEYNIKVSYGDFADETTVKVEPLKMTSIAITTPPEKTEFLEGTDIDLTGMIVTGTYNNEKTEEITDYTIEQYSNTVGSRTIRISYGELNTELTVKFVRKSIISIQIASLPAKLLYSNDEATLDTTGLTVNAIYNNGDIQPITNYTISGFYGTKSGKQTITVSCEGFSDTFEVEVKRYDFKIDSNISKQYDFDTKTLTVGTHIASRTDAKAVKVLVAVYDSNGALMGVKAENVFFDTNEAKDLSVEMENVEYPFDAVKVFVWDFDLDKMLPLAVGV